MTKMNKEPIAKFYCTRCGRFFNAKVDNQGNLGDEGTFWFDDDRACIRYIFCHRCTRAFNSFLSFRKKGVNK